MTCTKTRSCRRTIRYDEAMLRVTMLVSIYCGGSIRLGRQIIARWYVTPSLPGRCAVLHLFVGRFHLRFDTPDVDQEELKIDADGTQDRPVRPAAQGVSPVREAEDALADEANDPHLDHG